MAVRIPSGISSRVQRVGRS